MIPSPGSVQAQVLGCTCPVIDNCYGRGCNIGSPDEHGSVVYVYHDNCKIHGKRAMMRRACGYVTILFAPNEHPSNIGLWNRIADLFTQE